MNDYKKFVQEKRLKDSQFGLNPQDDPQLEPSLQREVSVKKRKSMDILPSLAESELQPQNFKWQIDKPNQLLPSNSANDVAILR
mmetsp:Transcript_8501/g.14306  ORF Transcript_8501/g.14306 Transcript_8501/m.14306 type:complete len:84 (-) Transcript_8501:248-499(-)